MSRDSFLYEDINNNKVMELLERCAKCPKCGSKDKDVDMVKEKMTCKECGEVYS